MAISVTRPRFSVLEFLGWPFLLLAPEIVLSVLLQHPEWDGVIQAPISHFFVVSLTAFLALTMAVLVSVAARQLRDAQILFLALAFAAIAGIFLAHALTTPGALV